VALVLVLLGSSAVLAAGPLDVLTSIGLVKSKKFFVLPAEEKVLEGIYNLRPRMATTAQKWGDWAAILQNEYEHQYLSDWKIQVIAHLNDCNTQLAGMPRNTPLDRYNYQQAVQYRNTVEQELRATNTQLAVRQKRLVSEFAKERAEGAFKTACSAFLDAKGQLWPQVEEVYKKYDGIKQNDSALNALRALNRDAHANLKIGPSDELAKSVKEVVNFERNYSPETAPQVKKYSRNQRLEMKKKKRG
jgi:hypothetical protein